MPTNTTAYSVNDTVRFGVVVKSTAGTNTNSAVTLTIKDPLGTVTAYGPISTTNSTVIDHTTTGTWRKSLKVTEPGRYVYDWDSTGAITMSTGGAFAVRPKYTSTST